MPDVVEGLDFDPSGLGSDPTNPQAIVDIGAGEGRRARGPFPVPVEPVLVASSADAFALARGAALSAGGLVAAAAVFTVAKIFEEIQSQDIAELIRGQDNAIKAKLAKKRLEKTLRTTRMRTPESRVIATRAQSDAAAIQALLPATSPRGLITLERETRALLSGRSRDLEPAPAADGAAFQPPTGRSAALSEEDRFPFRDPFEEPLGDDPLPPTKPPGFPLLPVPLPTEIEIPAPERLPDPRTRPTPTPAPTPKPAPAPRRVPRPTPTPRRVPFGIPLPFRFPAPRPISAPSPVPLTPVGPGRVDLPSTIEDPTSFAAPQPFTSTPQDVSRCPPCKAEEEPDTPRTECFKKLVKENVFPSQDEVFNWVEIDCFTGREL